MADPRLLAAAMGRMQPMAQPMGGRPPITPGLAPMPPGGAPLAGVRPMPQPMAPPMRAPMLRY